MSVLLLYVYINFSSCIISKTRKTCNRFTIQSCVKQVFRILTSRPHHLRFHGRNWRQFCRDKKPRVKYIYTYIKMIFWSRTSSKTFYCYSEFHASYETIIRQLPRRKNTWCIIVVLKKAVIIHNWLRCIATVKHFTVNCKNKSYRLK